MKMHRDYENDKHDKHDETDNIDDDDDEEEEDEENRENRPNQENQENHNDDNYEDKTIMTRYDQNIQKKTTKEFYYHLPSYYFYEWIFRSFTHWKIFQVQV